MASTTRSIDPAFTDLPLLRLADAALSRARDFHVSHADFRLERIRSQTLRLRDATLQGSDDQHDLGFGVRVIVDGTWGFAASVKLTVEEAVRVTEQAVSVAKVAALINHEPIELATEPPHSDATWVSLYDVDPFTVATADKVELLAEWSRKLLAGERVGHVAASLQQVLENKFYADTSGTTTTQQRVRIAPVLEAHGFDKDSGHIDSMRTLGPPTGRGWEYLTGTGWDWAAELAEIPEAGRPICPTRHL
jgi:TldD protein